MAPYDLKTENQIQIGIEFFPKERDQNLRLHSFMGYNQIDTENESYSIVRINTGISARF